MQLTHGRDGRRVKRILNERSAHEVSSGLGFDCIVEVMAEKARLLMDSRDSRTQNQLKAVQLSAPVHVSNAEFLKMENV